MSTFYRINIYIGVSVRADKQADGVHSSLYSLNQKCKQDLHEIQNLHVMEDFAQIIFLKSTASK